MCQKRSLSTLLFALLIALFSHTTTFASPFQLSGRITNQSGTPIADATIDVIDPSTNTVVATTNSNTNGNYTLTVDEGIYNIQVIPLPNSGFNQVSTTNYNVNDNITLDFVLVHAGTITLNGQVQDTLGNGVPNQQITLTNGSVFLLKYTDANGNYSFEVTPGNYNLELRTWNPNSSSVNLPLEYQLNDLNQSSLLSLSEDTILDLVVPVKKVDVFVQDPAGNPVGNVLIRAQTTNYWHASQLTIGGMTGFSGHSIDRRTTDASGNAVLWLFPGSGGGNAYSFAATPPSNQPFAQTALSNVDITSNTSVTITLASAIKLNGQVQDTLGNGVPNQQITLTNGSVFLLKYTDANGNYSFEVTPGNYNLELRTWNPNSSSVNLPLEYQLNDLNQSSLLSLSEDTILDLVVPVKKVDVFVQDPAGNPVGNVLIRAQTTNYWHASQLTIGGMTGFSGHSIDRRTTDASGNAVLWLFPGSGGGNAYSFAATPPSNQPFATFNIGGVDIVNSRSVIIVLQFVHAPPFTAVSTTPNPNGESKYEGSVTVSLSATATADFSIDATYYRLDGSDPIEYTDPFVISGEGVHILEYWSVDSAGVYETPKTKRIEIVTPAPVPTLTSLSPANAVAVSDGFTLRLRGTGFVPSSGVRWNGAARQTTFVSETELTAVIPPGDLTTPETAVVTVFNPAPGGGTSNGLDLTITEPTYIPDLSIRAAGISFSPSNPNQTVTLKADVVNLGTAAVNDLVVGFYEDDILLGETTVDLAVGATANAAVQTAFPTEGFHLITVKADPDDAVFESNEDNNSASQLLRVGQPSNAEATIVVQANNVSACRGGAVAISGQADYDLADVAGTADHPVQGDSVTTTLFDPGTTTPLAVFVGAKTNTSGGFSQTILAPSSNGTYPVTLAVTDQTLTAETEITLTVSGACTTPPPPPPPDPGEPPSGPPDGTPGDQADVYVYAEHILFSDNNPAPNDTVTVFAYIHYLGDNSVTDVAVTVNDIRPVAGALTVVPIDTTSVSFPNGDASSPVAIAIPWPQVAAGAHIIQVVVEPTFSQFTGNDKATRLILVGDASQLELVKEVTLAVDADNNGIVSGGDTLAYTITYRNYGQDSLAGAVLLDDYDELLLETPTQISDGGTAVNGTLRWQLGTLAADSAGSVTYRVKIRPASELPSGRSRLTNYALLTADDVPAVGTSQELELTSAQPPTVTTAASYDVAEGGSVQLSATGTDPNNDPLSYAWDLDNDGEYETAGQSVTFSAADLDGPASQTVGVQVMDDGGLTGTETAVVTIKNVAPTPAAGSNQAVYPNETVYLAGTWTDPAGSLDNPYSWSWDLDGDGVADSQGTADFATLINQTTQFAQNGLYTLTFTVVDKDGDSSKATVQIEVMAQPATCDLAAPGVTIISGTMGNDKLIGTPGNDIILGYGGDDRIEGLGGNDCLIGGPGNDQLFGNEGNDILWGGEVDNAVIYTSRDRDKLYGDDGDDKLYGGGDQDRIEGGAGDDLAYGGDDADKLYGKDGNDELHGEAGRDTLKGDKGDDILTGGSDQDNLQGNDGNDTLSGDDGDDKLYGGKGDDTLDGGADRDTLEGSKGTDTCLNGERLKGCEL